jgi:hypothetical protein
MQKSVLLVNLVSDEKKNKKDVSSEEFNVTNGVFTAILE